MGMKSFRYILQNVLDPAIQDLAQCVDGVGVYVFVFAEAIQLPVADAVFVDQLILGDSFYLHCGPKTVKNDHGAYPTFLCI